MQKKSFIITTFFGLLLVNIFCVPTAKADPAQYRWSSATTINSSAYGVFNDASEIGMQSYLGTAADDYYAFSSTCASAGYETTCFIGAEKSNPTKGKLYIPGTTMGQDIIIADNGYAPDPMVKITDGAIWGQIYQEGDWKGTNWEWMIGKKIELATDAGIKIQDLTVHTASDNNPFPVFDMHTIAEHNDGYLWPGRYRLKFYERQKADCNTGNITGDLTDGVENLLCTVTLKGIFNFDLIATGNGGGRVVPATNEQQKEIDSLGTSGVTTADLKSEPKIQMAIEYKLSTPLSDAIQAAIANVLEWVQTVMDWGKEGIQKILVQGNDLENQAGVQAVWKATRNVTLSLLTLGILIIAFANILQINIQSYGLGRMLPRMVIGIVFTYFSFLISTFLLDMMSAFQALLLNNTGANSASNALGSLSQQFSRSSDLAIQASAVGELIFLCLIGVALALVVIWLYVILIVRIAMLYIIVGIAPIAFMAYIMPFTEQYYKQWWAAFWKWAFMGPAVAFMLWLSQKFLTEGYFGTKQAQTEATMETWVWLIGAGVLLWLAATLPLKMGKEVYNGIQGAWKSARGGKIPGTKGLSAYLDQRKKGIDDRRMQRVTTARRKIAESRLGRTPLVGSFVTGAGQKERLQLRDQAISETQKRFGMDNMSNDLLKEKILHGKELEAIGAARILADKGFLSSAVSDKDGGESAKKVASLINLDQKVKDATFKSSKDTFAKMEMMGTKIMAGSKSAAELTMEGTNMKDWKEPMYELAKVNQKFNTIAQQHLCDKNGFETFLREGSLGSKKMASKFINEMENQGKLLQQTMEGCGIDKGQIDNLRKLENANPSQNMGGYNNMGPGAGI